MSKFTCPLCGSESLRKTENKSTGDLTLGQSFEFKATVYKCNVCSEEFDPSGETDKNFLKAQKEAQTQMVNDFIIELKKNGITMSFFERVFELPIRTLTRWKTGDFSSASLALMRIIKTYPWMTHVAEHGFEKAFAERALTQAANSNFIVENESSSDATTFCLSEKSTIPYYLSTTISG